MRGVSLILEGTAVTEGLLPAEALGQADHEGVILVEEAWVGRKVLHEKTLGTCIIAIAIRKTMIPEKTPGVGVDYKDGFIKGVKEYAVGRFLADPRDSEEALPQGGLVSEAEFVDRGVELVVDDVDEGLEAGGLYVVKARGTDELGKIVAVQPVEPLDIETARLLEASYRLLHVSPRCILGENSTDHNLEGGVGRPPVTFSECCEKQVKDLQEALFHAPRL